VRIGQDGLSRSERITHFGLRLRPEGAAPAQCNSAQQSPVDDGNMLSVSAPVFADQYLVIANLAGTIYTYQTP
jgi:hypothetical protein